MRPARCSTFPSNARCPFRSLPNCRRHDHSSTCPIPTNPTFQPFSLAGQPWLLISHHTHDAMNDVISTQFSLSSRATAPCQHNRSSSRCGQCSIPFNTPFALRPASAPCQHNHSSSSSSIFIVLLIKLFQRASSCRHPAPRLAYLFELFQRASSPVLNFPLKCALSISFVAQLSTT